MELVLVRHAIAQAGGDPQADHLRALTAMGQQRMRAGAAGLRKIAPDLELIATSPYRRAVETAGILGEALGDLPIVTTSTLEPAADLTDTLDWLSQQTAQVICLVGHQPHLGSLIGLLLAGCSKPIASPKKGSACRVVLLGGVNPGTASLAWFLTPAQLRALAGPRGSARA